MEHTPHHPFSGILTSLMIIGSLVGILVAVAILA